MAFDRNSALPGRIRAQLPGEAQTIFRHACNSSLGRGTNQGRAFVAGFAAVVRAGYSKGDGGLFSKGRASVELVSVEKTWRLELLAKTEGDEQRVFYAWASVVEKHGVEVIDHDGDSWSPAEMEETAFEFVIDRGEHGEMHQRIAGSDLVASIPFTADLQKALGIDLGLVGWLVGFRVNDPGLWQKIKGGELPMLSIGGSGFREEVAA